MRHKFTLFVVFVLIFSAVAPVASAQTRQFRPHRDEVGRLVQGNLNLVRNNSLRGQRAKFLARSLGATRDGYFGDGYGDGYGYFGDRQSRGGSRKEEDAAVAGLTTGLFAYGITGSKKAGIAVGALVGGGTYFLSKRAEKNERARQEHVRREQILAEQEAEQEAQRRAMTTKWVMVNATPYPAIALDVDEVTGEGQPVARIRAHQTIPVPSPAQGRKYVVLLINPDPHNSGAAENLEAVLEPTETGPTGLVIKTPPGR